MAWIGDIFSFVWDISQLFLSAYQEVEGWWWPFHLLQYPLYGLYKVFWNLLTPIAHFWLWADDVWAKVQRIWTSEGILGLIKWWFPWLYDIGEWFVGRWNWFSQLVGDWWDITKTTVLGWIDEAWNWALSLIDDVNTWLATLQSHWDSIVGKIPSWDEVVDWWKNWTGNVMAAINSWWTGALIDVVALIATAFLEREDFWAGWQDFRDKIAEFFTDPLEFLWTLFTDWFLGPEG